MNIFRKTSKILLMGYLVCLSQQVLAISAQELRTRLENGERLTVIDIRSLKDYKYNHIPNALSIPARIIAEKKLPPLGEVVIYGDGFDEAKSEAAVNALNQKKGIKADTLEGGMAAWQSESFSDTRETGMVIETMRFISYQELSESIVKNPDIILVDLRRVEAGKKLINLEEEMPGVQIVRPAFLGRRKNEKGFKYQLRSLINNKQELSPMYILIDNGNETAESVYREFRAGGLKRVAILAGGERILIRHGQSEQKKRIIKGGERK